MAQTQKLTKADLADLMMGSATIAMLDVPANGEVTFSSLSFGASSADIIYTLKDSLVVTQDEGDSSDITLDQNDEILDSHYEPTKITFEGNYPAIQGQDPLGYFYTAGAAVTGVTSPDGDTYAGNGYDTFKPLEVYRTMLFVSESKKVAFILARVRLTVDFVPIENSSTPGYLRMHGVSLPNLKANEGNIAVLARIASGS